MQGKRTLIILGAGASACYEKNGQKLPTQKDILNFLMRPELSRSSSKIRLGKFISDEGLFYSEFLKNYLCNKYNIEQKDINEKILTKFWNNLAKRGLNLEGLYNELEEDKSEDGIKAKEDFIAIILASIRRGVGSRLKENICKYHIQIAKHLEPGDYIITFNWDTLIDDALLYECPFWYPLTGYGVPVLNLRGEFYNKKYPINSLVHLFHIHGSIGLYEPVEKKYKNHIVVVGPQGFCLMYELCDLMGMTEDISAFQRGDLKEQPLPKKEATEEELCLIERGYIREGIDNKIWYKPIFVSPSKAKIEYKNWYVSNLRRLIYSKLPFTEKIIIIGYSFPSSDFIHLKSFFITEIIPKQTLIICINLENDNIQFQKKVKSIFPENKIDFSINDFKKFCNDLNDK